MDDPTRPAAPAVTQAVMQQVTTAVAAHLRGEPVAQLYLAGGPHHRAIAVLGTAAAAVRAAVPRPHLLVCTGADFVALWHDTLRHGMTPFIRRALAATEVVVLDNVDALRAEPFAQDELGRLLVPNRLVLLSGSGHLRHVDTWSPALTRGLAGATRLCLHDGPCVTDADAWAVIDRVAAYYGFPRATLLSSRRTARVALARQVAMYLLREEGLTYGAVGRVLRRDHATVMHGHARIHDLALCQPGVRYDLDALRCAPLA